MDIYYRFELYYEDYLDAIRQHFWPAVTKCALCPDDPDQILVKTGHPMPRLLRRGRVEACFVRRSADDTPT